MLAETGSPTFLVLVALFVVLANTTASAFLAGLALSPVLTDAAAIALSTVAPFATVWAVADSTV